MLQKLHVLKIAPFQRFRFALVLAMLVSCLPAIAQTTLTTLPSTTFNGGNSLGAGAQVSFTITNNNAGPMLLTSVGQWMNTTDNNGTFRLYYSATSLTGAVTDINTVFTPIATSGAIPAPANGIQTVFTGLNFMIPGNTTYRFLVEAVTIASCRYSGTGSALTPNNFSGGGIILGIGDYQIGGQSVGYSGSGDGLTLTPRYYTGFVTLTPAAACTAPPTAGTAITNNSSVCPGDPFILSLTGGTFGTGQTFQWESAPTSSGPWTPINGATASSYTGTQTATTHYRCVATCSGQSNTSSSVSVSTTAALAGGTYTINNTQPTSGSNFNNFNDAFTALGCNVPTGNVTFNVSAGQTFDEPLIVTRATGTSTATITFIKSGSGANPIVRRAAANAGTGTGGLVTAADAIINHIGGDYFTYNGINFAENSAHTTIPQQMEHALLFTKSSATDGCNNNTIQNCTVSLSTSNTGSTGIFFSNLINGSTATITAASGSNSNNSIQGNTINAYTGIAFVGFSDVTPFALYDLNNVVGNVAANNINIGASGGTATCNGIYVTNANNANISNNIIATANAPAGTLNGINTITGTNSNVTINANRITLASTGTGTVTGILNSMGSTGINNTVDITNNQINGLSNSSTATLIGISNTSTAFTVNITGNLVRSLVSSLTGTLTGINSSGAAATLNVISNRVSGLTQTTGTTNVVSGLLLSSATTINVVNNRISDLNASLNTSATGLNALTISSGTNANIYYNTIRIGSANTTTTFGSAGIFINTTATIARLNNNSVENTSAFGSTSGFTVAFRRTTTATTTIDANTNNNNYFVQSGARAVIYGNGTNTFQTLALYKAHISPLESASVNEQPTYTSTVVTNPGFLKINTTTPTQLESGGIQVPGFTTDFEGDLRFGANGYAGTGSAPDIGADEFDGIPIDLTPPSVAYSQLLFTCGTNNRTLSNVTITDASGVPTSGALRPRIYYRKGTLGTWTSNPGTLNSGSATNGSWSFTIDYSQVGGVASGDSIDYFVVAQDVQNNIGSNPNGAVGTNVNTLTTMPSVPNRYTINGFLSGNINVGAGQQYATLTAAVAAYNVSCLTGPITFFLTDATYGVNETFPISINVNPDADATNFLTIKPASGVNATISGSSTSILRLNGADYVTIDGANAGGSLTIENTSTIAGATSLWLSSNGVNAGATNNNIKNVTIKGGVNNSTTTTVTFGVVVSGNTLGTQATTITGGDDNDNNTFSNITVIKARYGMIFRGNTNNFDQNNQVINSTIGANAFGADVLSKAGILAREQNGMIISGNTFQFIGGDFNNLSSGTDKAAIAITTDPTWPTTPVVGFTNGQIVRNTIRSIIDERTFSAIGIMISSNSTPSNNIVANNMISNLLSNGTASDQAIGIAIWTSSGDTYAYNTINMSGDVDPTAGSTNTSSSGHCLRIGSTGVVNPTILNNIFKMDMFSSNVPAMRYSAVEIPTSYSFGTGSLNYNAYWVDSLTNTAAFSGSIGGATNGGTFLRNVTLLQAATTQEANGIFTEPLFMSSTDLHLAQASASLPFDGTATPIASVTTDFDGQTRNATTPDRGADEFTLITCNGATAATITAPGPYNYCGTGTKIFNATGFNTGVGSSYMWELSTDNGVTWVASGEISPAQFNTGNLTDTTIIRLKTYCYTDSAVSNTITIFVHMQQIADVIASVSSVCEGTQITISEIGGTATSWQWSTGQQTPVFNTTPQNSTFGNIQNVYKVDVYGPGNCSATDSVIVTIRPRPSLPIVSGPSGAVCQGAPIALQVTNPSQLSGDANELTAGGTSTTTLNGSMFRGGVGTNSGMKSQILYTAAELTASGLSAGLITSLSQFNTSLATTNVALLNFNLAIKHTSLTALPTTFDNMNGGTSVFSAASFQIPSNVQNQWLKVNFQNGFMWNGTDNIIVQVCYQSPSTAGTSYSVRATTTTGTNSVVTATGALGCAIVSGTASAIRPNAIFGRLVDATYNWNPGNFTGNTYNFNAPNTNTNYTVIGNFTNGCSSDPRVFNLDANPTLVPTVNVTANFSMPINAGTVVTFTANTTNAGNNPVYEWFNNGVPVGTDNPTYTTAVLNNNDQITCKLTSNALCATPAVVTSQPFNVTVNPTTGQAGFRAQDCGRTQLTRTPQTVSSSRNRAVIDAVTGANLYQVQFASDFSMNNIVSDFTQAPTTVFFANVSGLNWGTTYFGRVRARIGGVWTLWSVPCSFTFVAQPTILNIPTTQLSGRDCGRTAVQPQHRVNADSVASSDQYLFRIYTDAAASNLYATFQSKSRGFTVSNIVPGLQLGLTYYVRVNLIRNQIVGPDGAVCSITMQPAPPRMADVVNVNLYPNPTQEFTTISADAPMQSITIVDLAGRTAIPTINTQGNSQWTVNGLNTLAEGVYLVRIRLADGNETTQRLMITK